MTWHDVNCLGRKNDGHHSVVFPLIKVTNCKRLTKRLAVHANDAVCTSFLIFYIFFLFLRNIYIMEKSSKKFNIYVIESQSNA